MFFPVIVSEHLLVLNFQKKEVSAIVVPGISLIVPGVDGLVGT